MLRSGIASAELARKQLADLAGLTYEDKRNVIEAGGYQKVLKPKDYRARYDRWGIAEVIVEAMPKATWRGKHTLAEDGGAQGETKFEKAWGDLDRRLKVWSKLQRADILAGLGNFSLLLIGAPGELKEELPTIQKPDQIAFLKLFGEDKARVVDTDLESDTTDARFGLPKFYTVTVKKGTGTQDVKIHESRVIHVAEGVLDDELCGKPRLRSSWNYLDDLCKVVVSGAEAAWRNADPGLHLKLASDATLEDDEIKDLEAQLEKYVNNLTKVLQTEDLDIEQLSSSVAQFGGNGQFLLKLIAASSRLPLRLFIGSERGELASSQDRQNWNERVTERRENYAEAVLVRPLVDRLQKVGALPPAEYDVRWAEMDNLTEAEKPEVAERIARTNRDLVEAGDSRLATAAELRKWLFGWEPLEDDAVAPGERVALHAVETFNDVDIAPEDPEWEAIHRAADAHTARLGEGHGRRHQEGDGRCVSRTDRGCDR